ncbi:hypothetical protein B0I26_11159 [Anoxybacillus vitaminiphilus]|uniref:Uncharacterized protein n=1 Tax=Paranoxybacillus vitaminiphilus TaxID=581036 RepID=A0A327YCN4_9BACL|nr:hypothetical protein [Anoxybacillus vitaminiphilus]RAK18241.1 hypothetical protein B0I26_11159 [Anoxybacillus vitaminiphilus]
MAEDREAVEEMSFKMILAYSDKNDYMSCEILYSKPTACQPAVWL